MATPNIIADFTTQLTVALAVGGTTATINTNLDDDGNTLPDGLYYFTLDGANSSKEHISCTKTGTALSAIKSVSRQGVEVSGAARAHRVGASVVMTDFNTYKAYIDSISIAGATNATQSVQGLVQIATSTQIDNDNTTGSTGAILAMSPDQLASSKYYSRLPSAAEKTNLPILATLTGMITPYAGRTAPIGWQLCDGTALLRSTDSALFAVIAPSKTVTITIASPAVLTATAHGFVAGDKVSFTTTGALPTGLAVNTDYYVIATGLTTDNFRVSTSRGGSAVNTSGSQSGVHTIYATNYGKGDGSTTFNVPDLRGYTPYGYKSSDANFDALNVPNTYVGAKTHTLVTGEIPAHTHSQIVTDASPGSGAGFTGSGTYALSGSQTSSTGGDGAHNNMPPYVVVNFIIKK